ncbi:hypothetical protein KUH03_09850 [Sphingobacterium sp. E70]|uniref:hypothetical protein n=1 Tax=Sphingobacterium sp. E70 TaxID=2853439 RepID=UPI00211C2FAA|nr:hypothetical protein [Sphingobacterium sp. E70]ULT29234.1 hypothetical protein KUH03_09850 [Sphingobacterium sp. E70]
MSALIDMNNFTAQATLTKIYTAVFNFNYDTTPLWYMYMLIGLYLIIPIIGSWLNQASKKIFNIFSAFGNYTSSTLHQNDCPNFGLHGQLWTNGTMGSLQLE